MSTADPAGWNRIRELEQHLRNEREGREIERRALINAMQRIEVAEAEAEQYGEQLEAVGEELDRWKAETRLVGKNREHAERLEDILEGERS